MAFIDVLFIYFNMYPQVLQKQTLSEVEKLSSHFIASYVTNNCDKNHQNLVVLLQVMIRNLEDVFSLFLFISTHISLGSISQGSAEANVG